MQRISGSTSVRCRTCGGLASGQQAQGRHRIQSPQGVVGTAETAKVTVVNGFGTLTPEGAVAVDGQTLSGGAVIICSGSEPRSLPGLEVDGERIVTSDQATNSDAETLPERVAVIGGGVIGAEFASVFTDFGVQTTLLERFPTACCRLVRTATPRTCSRRLLRSAARTSTPRPASGQSRRPVTVSLSRSRRRRAPRRSRSTSCSSPSVAVRSARGWGWRRPASSV